MAGYDGRGAKFNIVAVEGNDLSFTVTAVDDAAAAINLSAATITATIYNAAGTALDTFTDAVSGAGSNIITLSLTDTEVDALVEPRTWALVVTRSGDARTWLAGSFVAADPSRVRSGTSGTAITATVDTDVTVTATAIGWTDVSVALLPTANGTDDTTAIQAVLTANAGKTVRGIPGESYEISDPLVISSGTTLDMTGCTITLLPSSDCNMLQNTAAATAVRTSSADAVVTSGSAVVTSATAAFVAGDVGRVVQVNNTTANTGSSIFGTVVTVDSATQVTLDTLGLASQSGGVVSLFDRDSDITVHGGTWDRGANSGTADALHSINFRHIDDLTIEGLTVTSTAGKYAIKCSDANRVSVHDITLDVASDGVHFDGPASSVTVRGVRGPAADDTVAFTASNGPTYAAYMQTYGPISEVLVDDVVSDCETAVLKITCGTYSNVTKLTASNITQLRATRHMCVSFADDTGALDVDDIKLINIKGSISTPTTGSIGTLTIQGLSFEPLASSDVGVLIQTPNVYNLKMIDCHMANNVSALGSCLLVKTTGTTTVKRLSMSDCTMQLSGTVGSGCHLIDVSSSGSTISNLAIDNCAVRGAASYFVRSSSTGTITDCTLSNCYHDGVSTSGGFLTAFTSGVTLTRLALNNCTEINSSWFADLASTTDVYLNNVYCPSGSINVRATGVVTVYGSGIVAPNGPTIAGGGSLRSRSIDFPMVVTTTGVAVNSGDTAYSTSAAAAPFFVGPVVADGTRWVRAHTGIVQASTATLVGGTVTVSNAAITSSASIRLTCRALGGTPGALYISAKVASTSFTITSTSATDTSTVLWEILSY